MPTHREQDRILLQTFFSLIKKKKACEWYMIGDQLGNYLQARVDLGAMTMKEYSAFPKAPALRELHHQIV